jgi:uncharacterized membrane protein YqjE
MDDIQSQAASEPPKPSLKKLGGALVGLLQGHLELLGIEFQEEKSRSFRLFIFSGLSLIFGLLVLLGLSTVVLIACWDTYRHWPVPAVRQRPAAVRLQDDAPGARG